MNKSWWLMIMPLKFTKFISYGTFTAFDGVQILLLNNFMSIYLLIIRNWSVWMLAFTPCHGLQNGDAVCFLKKKVPNEIWLICTNFIDCTETSPEVQSARCERWSEEKKRNTKTSNTSDLPVVQKLRTGDFSQSFSI